MKRKVFNLAVLLSTCAWASLSAFAAGSMSVIVSGYRIGAAGAIQGNLLDPSVVRVSPNGITTVFDGGGPVQVSAVPGDGYVVIGWQGFVSNPIMPGARATVLKMMPDEMIEKIDEYSESAIAAYRSVSVAYKDNSNWLYLVPVLAKRSGGGSDDVMRVTPVGYRLGESGAITPFSSSVVTVSPSDTSIARPRLPVVLTAKVSKDYKVVDWQKFTSDPSVRTSTPVSFGGAVDSVSILPENGVEWLYVAVVVEYDPVRTVTVSKSTFGKGTVTITPAGGEYKVGDTVTLSAEPATGYKFVRWSDGNTEHRRTLTVDESADYKAYIEPISSVVKFDAGTGAVLVETEKRVSYDYAYGELPVPTLAGHIFTGWVTKSGDGVNKSTVVKETVDHTLTAKWGEDSKSYTITCKTTGDVGDSTVSGGGSYASGTTVTLTATPGKGREFTGWTDGKMENPRSITVTDNATYTAKFDKKYGEFSGYLTKDPNLYCFPYGEDASGYDKDQQGGIYRSKNIHVYVESKAGGTLSFSWDKATEVKVNAKNISSESDSSHSLTIQADSLTEIEISGDNNVYFFDLSLK